MVVGRSMKEMAEKPPYEHLEESDEVSVQTPVEEACYDDQHIRGHKRQCQVVAFATVLLLMVVACLLFFFSFKLNMRLQPQENHQRDGHSRQPAFNEATLLLKYRLENSHDETTLYRNYLTGYETMKWRSGKGVQSICYIRKMRTNDMRNSTALSKSFNQLYRSHFYEEIAAPVQQNVEALIGFNAYADCADSHIKWVEPMQYEVYVNPARKYNHSVTAEPHGNDDNHRDNSDSNDEHRVRRSIRSCRQTCCWRVCCCDVHHFHFQVAEEFNCNHVCNKCSRRYKSVIERLC